MLPLANRSAPEEDAFFVDGIHDDILTQEGAVQRAGNRVRVNVRLIDASTDRQLWAQTYDEELTG